MGMITIMGIKLNTKFTIGELLNQLVPVMYKNRLACAIKKISAARMRLLCLDFLEKNSMEEMINPCKAPNRIKISKKGCIVSPAA